MKQRIITGIIGGAGFLLLLYLGSFYYSALIVLLALIGYYEFLKMHKTSSFSVEAVLGFFAILLIIISQNGNIKVLEEIELTKLLIGIMLAFFVVVVLKKNKVTFDDAAYYLLGILYVGFGFSYMLETRLMENGLAITLLVIISTWASDSGAYFTGKYLGKNKLWPAISPKKTIEGSIGGVVFAAIFALITNYFANLTDNYLAIILIGVIIAVTGQFGDLVESALKRSKDVKDSGSLLPGHGGVLDRFDSLIFVFPILNILNIIQTF